MANIVTLFKQTFHNSPIHIKLDTSDSAKMIQTLTKKGPVYKIKFRYGAFAENKMSGEFSDIEQNPKDFAADIISQVLDECLETLSLKSDIELEHPFC